jgi:hypothetical protein
MRMIEKPFTFSFVTVESKVLLELMNTTDLPLRSIEVLTIFLKDQATAGGGPSQAHIRFDGIKSMLPQEKAIVNHRTWINGKPATAENDQLARLGVVAGMVNPYVLDISWEDVEGKTRFQRIAVGH